jgi:hypothetical protein
MDRREAQEPSAADIHAVVASLGRQPRGRFKIAVRRDNGDPMVIANEPLLNDGTPMPTSYWLVDPRVRAQVSCLESAGGVKKAEATIPAGELADAHTRYASERDSQIPEDWSGPRPSGGIGGTRQGVKCLHSHIAWWLAGGDDPVGAWVAEQIGLNRTVKR